MADTATRIPLEQARAIANELASETPYLRPTLPHGASLKARQRDRTGPHLDHRAPYSLVNICR
jgi:hypothetical protein